MRSLAAQLHDAMIEKGWSVAKLLEESGLDCTTSSLNRKLRGLQKLSTEECEVLANTMGVTVAWSPVAHRKSSAA